MPITTTLNRIRAHRPCSAGWRKLLDHLGKTQADDEPLPFATVLKSNGLDDALWCCRAEPQHSSEWRLFAVSCARIVQHLMTDPRSAAAIDVAERHAIGTATDAELDAAWAGAWDAAGAAAPATARAAAMAAARAAAMATAWDAARDAAPAGAWAAARAAAMAGAWDAAGAAAMATAWDEMASRFLAIVSDDAAVCR